MNVNILISEGKVEEVRRIVRDPAPSPMVEIQWRLFRAFLEKRPAAEIEAASNDIEAEAPGVDGEPLYFIGHALAFCGQREKALKLLRKALDHGFIPYPYMDTDRAFASCRTDPSFQETRALAIERQKKFLAYRAAHP
jgi:hypothetical protein